MRRLSLEERLLATMTQPRVHAGCQKDSMQGAFEEEVQGQARPASEAELDVVGDMGQKASTGKTYTAIIVHQQAVDYIKRHHGPSGSLNLRGLYEA